MSLQDFIQAGVFVTPQRSLGGFVADVVVEEQHSDSSTITDHPIEQGSVISDHIFDEPAELSLTYGWSLSSPQNEDSPALYDVVGQVKSIVSGGQSSFLIDLYTKLRALKSAGTLIDIYTGKRLYHNMLIRNISVTTDKSTENILLVRIDTREAQIVTTTTFTVPADKAQVATPEKTLSTVPLGTVQLNAGPANLADPTDYLNGFQVN